MNGPTIIKGRETPMPRARYDFDVLTHGDALIVASPRSCIEMFRRWRNRDPKRAAYRLVASHKAGEENVLFFVDETKAGAVTVRRKAPGPLPSQRFGSVTTTVRRDRDEI